MAFCVIYKYDSQLPPRFERCMTKLQGVQVRQILQREASMEISNIAIAIRHQIGSDGACLGEKLAERSGMLFFD